MRGFMRAIGLGGLFRRHGPHGASASHPSSSALRSVTVEDIHQVYRESLMQLGHEELSLAQYDAIDEEYYAESNLPRDSIGERPQFLFFCGSDHTSSPAEAIAELDKDFAYRGTQAMSRNVTQPYISHQMPVFFAPRQGITTLSPTASNPDRKFVRFFEC